MKILLVSTGLGMGGAEKQVCDLADQFFLKKHEIQIIALTGELVLRPQQTAIQIEFLKMKKNLLGFWRAYFQLRKIVKAYQPDIVHAHMFHANIMSRLLRFTVSMPCLICSAHSTNEGGRLRMLVYRLSNFLSDVFTNVSQDAVNAFVKKKAVSAGNIKAMPNGIDITHFKKMGIKEEKTNFIFIAIGRLHIPKDYPNLLKAFSLLYHKKTHVRLWIVGGGELEKELQSLAQKLQINDRVKFLGQRTDVSFLLNQADAFVLSSRHEGLPLSVIEAMACEKVVVATDCGGVKEVMDGNGFLVNPQDSQALSQAMVACTELSVKKREQIGRASRQHVVNHYAIEKVSDKWLDLYQRCKQNEVI